MTEYQSGLALEDHLTAHNRHHRLGRQKLVLGYTHDVLGENGEISQFTGEAQLD